MCAFHIKWDDIPLDQNVAKWAVNVISLSRTKRHLDRAALMTFWEKLDRSVSFLFSLNDRKDFDIQMFCIQAHVEEQATPSVLGFCPSNNVFSYYFSCVVLTKKKSSVG